MTNVIKYRPSNGTEGAAFITAWCGQCARDAAANGSKPFDDCDDGELCPIIALTFAHDVDEPEYPVEWQMHQGGPVCTAFVPVGTSIAPARCEHTQELPL